jgi:hypothetical protein
VFLQNAETKAVARNGVKKEMGDDAGLAAKSVAGEEG